MTIPTIPIDKITKVKTYVINDYDHKLSYIDMFNQFLYLAGDDIYFPDIYSIEPIYTTNQLTVTVKYYDYV